MEKKDRLFRHILLSYKRLLNQGSSCEKVLFVAGMQRSGTNMLMDTLERSYYTDVYHEWDKRAFDNYQMRDRTTILDLLEKSKGQQFVIKALCELEQLTELMAVFKNSKTIWIFRRYQDVVNSMTRSFRNMDKQIIRLANDPDSEAWLGKGMSERTHATLKDVVKPDINLASASALQWYIRNVLFFEQGFERNEKVLPVIYEQLVDIPKFEMERVFRFAKMNYSERIIRNIHSGSVGRREPPVIDVKIKELCSFLEQKIAGLKL